MLYLKQDNKAKSILEDPLKVISERAKKQQNTNEKQFTNENQKQNQNSIEKSTILNINDEQIINSTDKNVNSNKYDGTKGQKGIQKNQNATLNSNNCKDDSLQQQPLQENTEKSNVSDIKGKHEQNISSQDANTLDELNLSKQDSKIAKNESKRYFKQADINMNKNMNEQSFLLNLNDNEQKDYQVSSQYDLEKHIGLQKSELVKNQNEHRVISPITSNNNIINQDKIVSDNQLKELNIESNNQSISTANIIDQNRSSSSYITETKQNQQNKKFLTPDRSKQNRFKSDQKQKDHEKLKNYANRVKSNQSLVENILTPTHVVNELYDNIQPQNDIPQNHFRMDGNYYQKAFAERNHQNSQQKDKSIPNQSILENNKPKNQFIIRKERNSQSKQTFNNNQAQNNDGNQTQNKSNSGQKLFTKSFYEDENHKNFIKEKMKERKQLQIKREKSLLEQQEILKKKEIEQIEQFNKRREQVLQERALLIQERMKKNRQYIENLEANKSSSRERSQFESIQKPLFIEYQEKFEQNQMKEIEERKRILERVKLSKKHINYEEIVRHEKEYENHLLERQNSKQKNKDEWHYQKPKFQSKLWEICQKEKQDQQQREQEIQFQRKQREERRHRFGEQLREDIHNTSSANKRQSQPLIISKQRQQSARTDKDTLESQFLNQSKLDFDHSPKIGNQRNLIDIIDEAKDHKKIRRQDDSKYSSNQSRNIHLMSAQSMNNNSSATIDCNQLQYSQKQDYEINNKVSSSQCNLNHLNNRNRGKQIQRQHTTDQFLQNSDFDQQLWDKNSSNKYYMKQNFKNSNSTLINKNHQLSNESIIQYSEDVHSNFFVDQSFSSPSKKYQYPHHKIRSAKDRLNSVNSSIHNVSLVRQRKTDNLRTEKSNDSKNMTENYQDLIKLHDTNLTKKLNNKSRSIYEKVEDIRVETQKMEQIANKQTQLLRVSSNEEIDRTFISNIYIKSIQAKLAVLDQITPDINLNHIKIDQQIHSENNQRTKKAITTNEDSFIIASQVVNNTSPSTKGILKKELKFADQ